MTRKNEKQPPSGAAAAETTEPDAVGKERVAKVMARAGLCSRRDAEAWIRAGRVAVDGKTILSPALNVGPDDRVSVDGVAIEARERTRLFLYHKPRGVVTTAKDPEGRPTVFERLPEGLPRLVSVGRLDINTEGLLLLTNDGGLARMLELPATGWLRRYRVRANGTITPDRLEALKEGITIDGMAYAGIEATLDRGQGANVWLTMGLREGKNREIKRVLEHLGLYVNRLIRLSFGPFRLGEIAEGEVEEVRTRVLQDQLGEGLAKEAGVVWEDAAMSPVVTAMLAPDHDPPRQRSYAKERTPRVPEQAPRRDRPQPGARPHMSALRSERMRTEDEPRRRITRAATEDRKGRAVAVERITVPDKGRHSGEGGTSRNARNFARERREAEAPDAPQRPRKRAAPEANAVARPGVPKRARGGFGSDRPQTGRALKEGKARPQQRSGEGAKPPRGGDRPPRAGAPTRGGRNGPRSRG